MKLGKKLSIYALGMSYKGISQHIEEIYAFRASPAILTVITDKIILELR
jgi:putative transposase